MNSKVGTQRKIILEYVFQNGEITKKKAVELTGHFYFCNEEKHVGDILSRMVNSGKLERIKNGLFKLGKGSKSIKEQSIGNQSELFQ